MINDKVTSFKIFNDTGKPLRIIHEPECFEFELPLEEEVTIETDCGNDTILLRTSVDNGNVVIAILDDQSFYKVLYKGEDVFEKYF